MSSKIEFAVCIEYGQIVVCEYDEPFNLWTDRQVRQGFSWRPGVVAFGTPDDRWDARLFLQLTQDTSLPERATRALAVPYQVLTGRLWVGSVTSPKEIEMPVGIYELRFAMVPTGSEAADYYLSFIPKDVAPAPRILLSEEGIAVPDEFDMNGEPAI